ncbi:uncharacterized protein ACIBXB_006274 [Morphnus guianensis]
MRHLIEGCLAYPNENQQLLALYWGLAYAYRAIVQHSQRTTVEAGTQTASEDTMLEVGTQTTTTTTVIAPIVKRKQWTRRSTGPYHRLVREEEEEEGLDLEAGPLIKKLEEGVRELKQEAETTQSLTSSELRDLRKDYSRQPGERIAAWLLRCWDNGADSQQLEGKEAQQLGSLARNRGIERGIGKEAAICSLWSRLLSSVRARYPFKEDLVNSSEKWTTADEGIQYLRELAVVEVIYSDLDDEEVSKDPEDVLCTRAMWRKVIQGAPASYSNSLAAMYCPDMETPTVEKVSSWLQNFEENLCVSSSLQDSALALRDAPRNQSSPAPVRGKGSPRHINWEYHTVDTNRSRKFLKHIEDNLLVQVLRELTRKGALLDLLFVNREGLMGEVVIGGCLGHSDHEVVEVQIVGNRRKTANKTLTLDMGRGDFGLLKEDVDKVETFNAFFASVLNTNDGPWDPQSPVLEDHDWGNDKLPAVPELVRDLLLQLDVHKSMGLSWVQLG